MKGNYDDGKYKIYYHDNGLLLASLDDESSADLRNNRNLGIYKGALYESFVAEALKKDGYDLYYYRKKNTQLKMDFFVRDTDSLIPIEVKSNNGTSKSLNNLFLSDSYPDIHYGVKLSHQNIGFDGKYYTFPYFCTFLLRQWINGRK